MVRPFSMTRSFKLLRLHFLIQEPLHRTQSLADRIADQTTADLQLITSSIMRNALDSLAQSDSSAHWRG